MKVYNTQCRNCLLSKDRIVSPRRAKDIVKQCVKDQSYFICHKATQNGEDIMCRGYYDAFDTQSQLARVARLLGCLEFVEQKDGDRMISYQEMQAKCAKKK